MQTLGRNFRIPECIFRYVAIAQERTMVHSDHSSNCDWLGWVLVQLGFSSAENVLF